MLNAVQIIFAWYPGFATAEPGDLRLR